MFYRRLVAGTFSKRFKWALWIAMAFVVITTVVISALLLTTCRPMHAWWMQYDLTWNTLNKDKMYCTPVKDTVAVGRLAGSFSVITDFYSVMLPAVLLMRIRINKRQRWGLIFIFGIGYL
jgi:ABC-type Fe3+ transport system permease subunit